MAMALFVVGNIFRGIIAVELMQVLQMIYFSVSLVNSVPATMLPCAGLS
jgi:hypothetical protein